MFEQICAFKYYIWTNMCCRYLFTSVFKINKYNLWIYFWRRVSPALLELLLRGTKFRRGRFSWLLEGSGWVLRLEAGNLELLCHSWFNQLWGENYQLSSISLIRSRDWKMSISQLMPSIREIVWEPLSKLVNYLYKINHILFLFK